jgi:hypothetical protein
MPIITTTTDKLIISLDGFTTYDYGSQYGGLNNYDTEVGFHFVPQETFTLTTIIFFYNIQTAPSPNTWTIGVQSFNATSGRPSDVFLTSGPWIAPSSGNGFASVAVTPFSMIKGNWYWIVLRNGGLGSGGQVQITSGCHASNFNGRMLGRIFKSNNVWNYSTAQAQGNFWLYSGTKYYGPCCFTTTESDTARLSPNESGTTFKLPIGHPTITLKSMEFYLTTNLPDTVYSVKVKNEAGNTLATATVNGNLAARVLTFGNGSTFISSFLPYFEFDTSVDFVANTKYYIMLTGITGTPPLLRYSTNLNAQLMTDVRNGIEAHFVTYDGTSYTEYTNRTCQGYLMFDAIKYEQLGGTTIYSSALGFNQLDF